MTGSVTGLTRLTVSAPGRRLDAALPEHAPLAELLPELLRQAGAGLPDAGQAHGGWVLRRADGVALTAGAGLTHQGVRDGDVLYLVPARQSWPELEYDDVADAVASGARRYGRAWDAAATRLTGLGVCALALLLGALSLVRTPMPLAAYGIGAVLLLAGIVASRGYGDGVAGATLAALALPYAFVGGLPSVLLGSAAVVLAGVVGAVGVGHGLRVFAGAATAGLLGVLGALLALGLPAAGAAAAVLAVLVTGMAAVPLLAIRLGRLPMPVLTPDAEARPDRPSLYAAVVRTDELVTGVLLGCALVAPAAATVAVRGGVSGRVLVGVAALGFLLRARLFPTVRQRLPLLAAGSGGVLALAAALGPALPRYGVTGGLVVLALVAVLAGAVYRRRAPGPYLGRAADILDALCVTAVIPLACAVLGLYGRMRGLVS